MLVDVFAFGERSLGSRQDIVVTGDPNVERRQQEDTADGNFRKQRQKHSPAAFRKD